MLQRCLSKSRHSLPTTPCIHIRCYRTKGSKNKKTLLAVSDDQSVESTPSRKDAWIRPVTIPHGSQHHKDLASFLHHAKREKLSETSTVYIGTHYEYTVSASLARLGFDVLRTGKTSDYGIDLLGWWRVPASTEPIKVLLQCKAHAKKLAPQNVRELEGSFPGAPAQWQGKGVMGFLVAASQATKGMRDALIKSSLPLGFIQITREGRVLQMLWNHQATLWGLEGFGVTTKFGPNGGTAGGGVDQEIALTWKGAMLDIGKAALVAVERNPGTAVTTSTGRASGTKGVRGTSSRVSVKSRVKPAGTTSSAA
jgi:hypothetical protein